jgi:hypothetical protein
MFKAYEINLELGCFHPVACIRSGSGVSVEHNSVSIVVFYFITCFGCTTIFSRKYNFRCMHFHLKMVVRSKHVAANLNKIVKKY